MAEAGRVMLRRKDSMLTKVDVFAPLRPKHRRLVEEYARDWNATAAYKRAGYRAGGHSAEANACPLCKRLDVATAIRRDDC